MTKCIEIGEIIKYANDLGFDVKGFAVDFEKIIFEERVRINCFYCEKYGKNWKCPPNIPAIDYKKMFSEYDNIAFVYLKMPFTKDNYNEVRNESSVKLHKALLECEKYLYKNNVPMAISFIGGSCKLCKNGCAPNCCVNPYQSRTPVEALGINIMESLKYYGMDIKFPPQECMMRIGMLLW